MINVYTQNNCGGCIIVKSVLEQNHVDFQEINLDEQEDQRQALMDQGIQTTPTIFLDGELYCQGFNYDALQNLIKKEQKND